MSHSAYEAGYAFGAILMALLVVGLIGMGIFSIIMAFVRRTKGWITAAIIFGVLSAFGVGAIGFAALRGFATAIARQSKPKSIVSDDGWVRLEIPGTWTTLPVLSTSAPLKVGNKFREEYAMVFSKGKGRVGGSLDDFAKLTADFIGKKLGPKGEVGAIEKVTAGKFNARRCRIAGTVNNVDVVYLNYTVETPEGFHQLLMWTLPRKERDAWPVFERVANSFEVANPPKTAVSAHTAHARSRTPRKGTVEERLRAIVVEELNVPADKVKPEARIKEDLGADNLDVVELVMATEEEFGIEIGDEDAKKLTTVSKLVEYVSARLK